MVSEQSTTKGERFNFSADITKLMALIINTFYKNKEVFLREVISNSSDAIDKIRFLSITDPKVLGDEKEFKIEIIANKEAKTLTVRDNGIGMTKDEMIKNLGTIANSGTKAFMDAIKAGADIQMIGQFGVGFYSVFLVSNKVEVRSKHNDDVQHVWISTASNAFDIYDDSSNPEQLVRGTEITMHLKDDQTQFLEERSIKEIIKKHSEFVGPKIFLWTSKEVEVDAPVDEDAAVEEKEGETAGKIEEVDDDAKIEEVDDKVKIEDGKEEEEAVKAEPKKITEIQESWELVNKDSQPIWSMKPEEVKKEQYNSFYQLISNDWEEPLAYKHFHVEGQIEFRGIVFIPKRAPFDMFNNAKKNNNIKLYVRRVFINDNAKDLCPDYLSFVKGVVDSEEMPLNISRETLQQNNITKIIRKNIVKKTIELIEEIAEDKEKFAILYKNFSKNLKFGVHEDAANRVKLANFLRFFTTKTDKEPKSLRDYVSEMKKEQKDIYYITGESQEMLDKLPFLDSLKQRGLEVVYMTDPIDEYFVQQMSEFEGKKLVSVTKEGLELPQSEEEKEKFEQQKKDFEPFCKRMKEILGARVEKIQVSNRMTDSPCCISTGKYGWSARMEQIMKNQALRDTTFSTHMSAKKVLEINPNHSIIIEMSKRFADNVNCPVTKNLSFLMYETALLTSGGLTLEKPVDFANRIYKMTKLGLDIEDEADADMPELESVEGEKGEEKKETMEEVD